MKPVDETQLTFPCEFMFKIVGEANQAFEQEVIMIMHNHFPNLGEGSVKFTASKNAKYLSLTVTVEAVSQAQLNAAYQDLSASPLILFVI